MDSEQKKFSSKIDELRDKEEKLKIEKSLVLKNALHSQDVVEIQKAQNYISSVSDKKTTTSNKSLLIDPQAVTSNGFLDKNYRVSYNVLRNMAKVPIIKAIIETRKEQVLSFCEPQKNKYSVGFVVKPKDHDESKDLSKAQQSRIKELTSFILNCGDKANTFHGDTFNSFTRKFMDDSLTLDQGTWENVYARSGKELVEFMATDGATYRIADSFNDESRHKEKLVRGYLPYYVQVYNGAISAEFYPWELTFAVRNPQSNIYSFGYGKSELEDLISTVTSIINADSYNSNYFKVGANPKGILKVSGNISTSRLEEFKNHWQSQVAGVRNAHKLPVIEADKMDFISTQTNNKDMEYGKYQEYLIKLACAAYKIDPSEVGFPMSGSSDSAPMFEGNNEARLKYSKDKGLKPLLKFYQHYLNRNIMEIKDPNYEIEFVGLDAETPEQELEKNIKEVSNYKTVNEVRKSVGLDPLDDGDIILNPVMLQAKQMAMMGDEESNDYMDESGDMGMDSLGEEEENPFMKAIQVETDRILSE